MAHGNLNLRISGADHTPTTTRGLTKGRMAQALCNGLALSVELLILVLLLSFRLVELGGPPGRCIATWSDKKLPFGVLVSTRCLAIIDQSAKQPKCEPIALDKLCILSFCSPIFEESATASQTRGMQTPNGKPRLR